jgi:hypothetical protein
MTDFSVIERELRRIQKSHRSVVDRTAMANKLSQTVDGLHASIPDEPTRSEFRAGYRALVERTFTQSPGDPTTNKARIGGLLLEHARNLKEVEAAREKLNRELGDF